MSELDHLYVLIRVRKSGSQSLVKIMEDALPGCTVYPMPHDPPLADRGLGFWEHMRLLRRRRKRLHALFKTFSYSKAWRLLNDRAQHSDVIGGHFPYVSPDLPNWKLRYITLMREPLQRLYSEYRYCRQSFEQRPFWRRCYSSARIRIAGKGSFGDYIDYLDAQGERFTNPLVAYITGGQNLSSPYEFLREHYFHYGVLERINQFASELSIKLGHKVSATWQNRTQESGALVEETYDQTKLQRLIGRDLELYRSVLNELGT